jgi:DNA-3-methyladenine glycosylase
MPLPRSFYRRDAITLARDLLGRRLVRVHHDQRLAGIIVETEAYLGISDQAAHTHGGRHTKRNHSMWLDGGMAYIYFTYGMHHCFNVVAGEAGHPVAVLIRALQPVEGLPTMYRHRKAARRDTDLCSGPAKLCQALAMDRALDSVDLASSRTLFIEQARTAPLPRGAVARTPRIGVAYAGAWAKKPLRFHLRGNDYVSV